MWLRYDKMAGCGNEFMIIDGVRSRVELNRKDIAKLGNSFMSVGFDQMLIVLPPSKPDHEFACTIYNRDGSRAGQCGNGMRCVMNFIERQGLSQRPELSIELDSKVVQLKKIAPDYYQVDMGFAEFDYEKIPFRPNYQQSNSKSLAWAHLSNPGGERRQFLPMSFGNPHAVLWVEALDDYDVEGVGSYIRSHHYFPEGVNVGFAERIDADRIKLRVYERGVGETQACGSGACAAVVAGQEFLGLGAEVKVQVLGGELTVLRSVDSHNARVYLRGPTTLLHSALIKLNAL